ncbi:hypothetical protein GA707_10140 [Nostocoides sp. F2B08]|uniref:LytR C-terminal domain-containing protein n=1 Tax=Nostocoides sp. F2B08 TaxID=2653936 RepID=UPI001263A1F3|nr:LytR C-terminal domain-containing protein [Tetrasphaera sp. F2B08]KAB7743845.1 hypothetical protein GA707_10140 [Tetrasphaera sp. F2B08]
MSDYVYESGISSRRRRQRRTAITLLLTVVFLAGSFYWAWSYIRDGDSATAQGGSTPTPTPSATCVGPRDPKTITVHVYNSTSVPGLAARAAEELSAAGFQKIGNVANDPLDANVEVPIEVRFGPPGQGYAETFRDAYVPEAVLSDNIREGGSIDIVLGSGFTSFGTIPDLPPCE